MVEFTTHAAILYTVFQTEKGFILKRHINEQFLSPTNYAFMSIKCFV